MNRIATAAALASAGLLGSYAPCFAHAEAGARTFPVTLTLDDPGVEDEASIPTFSWQRQGNADAGPTHEYDITGEFDKRITARLGIAINDGYTIQSVQGGKTQTGWDDLVVTLKYLTYVNDPHEFIVSLGIIREFGRTGTAHIGADEYGNTTPTIYFGKGFGDVPVPALRPLAITGTAGFSIADKELKSLPGDQGSGGVSNLGANAAVPFTGEQAQSFNNGYSNRWVAAFSVQYSFPYLQSQVKDIGLGPFFGRLIPLVEVTYSSPASSPSNLPTQWVVAPGVIYMGDTYQVGVEALIPGNKASGTNVGVIAQFHVFFDDLFPNTLGKPIFDF